MTFGARCPTCGATLPGPGQSCPFCAEAQRLLQQLAETDDVRLCSRCGTILQEEDEELCADCRKAIAARAARPSIWRQDDRIATWLRDRFVEPVAERQGIACPSCGAAVPPLAVFCSQCGYRLAQPASEAGPPAVTPADTVPAEVTAVGLGPAEAVAESIPPAEVEEEAPPLAGLAAAPAEVGVAAAEAPAESMAPGEAEEEEPGPPAPDEEDAAPAARKVQTALWVLLGVFLLALVGLIIFLNVMLRSGYIVFR